MAPTGLPGHRGGTSEQGAPVPVIWGVMEELYRKARRVAKLYNGEVAPRHQQLQAMKELQELIHRLEAPSTSAPASKKAL